MNQTLLSDFGTPVERVERVLLMLCVKAVALWCWMTKVVKTKAI